MAKKNPHAVALGKRGGSVTSERKAQASRENGKKGGRPMKIRWCNYEHLGGCSDMLTHRVAYWIGPARKRFGPWAYFCEHHAPQAGHLGLLQLDEPATREPRDENGKKGGRPKGKKRAEP